GCPDSQSPGRNRIDAVGNATTRIVMNRLLNFIGAVALTASFQIHGAGSNNEKLPGPLLEGLGDLHHPVTTKSKQAQRYFDQGMRLLFGFNHKEAIRS